MKGGGLVESEKPVFTPHQVSGNLLWSKWMQIPQMQRKKRPAELSPSQTLKSISRKTQTHRKPDFISSSTHGNT